VERLHLSKTSVLFTNAYNLGFPSCTFDIALCGFMGWYECFDFNHNKFIQHDTKSSEIIRVLRDGGRFTCCSWEAQEDLAWMEESILNYYPDILKDSEYLARRPIGMAYEKSDGYEIIFRAAGFQNIEISREMAEFVSTDEEEWWRQMRFVGWETLLGKIEQNDANQFDRIKEAIFAELQSKKQEDGIHFTKSAFYVSGNK
jgi:ubiquinone/menaquinone biosynthesis C-methylase UbiE